jgi:flagellar assembly protein FliH
MKSFTRGRVVKSSDVLVSTPCRVENNEGFLDYSISIPVFDDYAEVSNTLSTKSLGWVDTVFRTEAKERTAIILAEAEAQAAMILAEAEEKAAMILAEAETTAQEIRAQTKAESDRLCKEVAEKVRAEVYPKAEIEGYQAGRKAGEEDGKRAFQDAEQLFQLAKRVVQEEYAKVENDLLHLAIKIAERLVRSSLAIEPQRLAAIIQALTLLPQESSGWRLHVSADDALWLEKNQPPCPCPWVIDESLGAGNCFLECQEGIFDARFEAQLDKLENILREELQHGNVEAIDEDGGTD